jgi:hypothetical protein
LFRMIAMMLLLPSVPALAGALARPVGEPRATVDLGRIEGFPVSVVAELRWSTYRDNDLIRLDLFVDGDGHRPEGSALVDLVMPGTSVGTFALDSEPTASGLVYSLRLTRAAFHHSRFAFQLESVDPPATYSLPLSRCLPESVEEAYARRPAPVVVAAPEKPWNFVEPDTIGPAVVFELQRRQDVVVTIFDIRGDTVVVAHDGPLESGEQAIRWNGLDRDGREVDHGIYLAEIKTEDGTQVRRVAYPHATFSGVPIRIPENW